MVRSAPVLGQAHTPRRRLTVFAAALALVALAPLTLPGLGGADPSQSAASLRRLDAQLEAEQRSAVLGLYALDRRLAASRTRLAQLHAQADGLRAERSELKREASLARHDSRVAETQLDRRLRALYDQRSVSTIEIVFGARSLDQALNDLDNLSAVTAQDEAVVRQLHTARTQLAGASRTLASRERALVDAARAAEATEAGLVAARAQRSDYVGSLAAKRRLTHAQVSRLVEQARAASARSTTIQHASLRASSAAVEAAPARSDVPEAPASLSPPPAGGRALTVTATGYSLGGTTATGLPVGWGVAAVDPATIPLGTHMSVPGYGEAVAADTGGAVGGAMIDLWFPTTAQAAAWGRRTVTVVLH